MSDWSMKNEIPEYHTPSPKRYNNDKYMSDWSMRNLLIQWDTEEENRKIYEVWLVKNLLTQWKYWRGIPRKDWVEERSKTFMLAW